MTENINKTLNKDLLLFVTKLIIEENQKSRLPLRPEIRNKLEDFQSKYIIFGNRCDRLEKQSRKNNIGIFGLDVAKSTPILEATLTGLSQLLEMLLVEAFYK